MKRRTFLSSAVVGGSLASLPAMSSAADDAKGRQVIELRTYTLKPDKQKLFDAWAEKALIPALNRLGPKSVGVYSENLPAGRPAIYHIVVFYENAEQWASVTAKLASDAEYQKGAAEYLAVQATDPVYDRVESSLFRAFETMPKVEKPAGKSQMYNLRIYESHNEAAGQKKIEMFNQGEIAIFRRVGLNPVFFGEAIAGSRMPNLTYLLAFNDDRARTDAWGKFGGDSEWKKLRAIPEYEDKKIVSKITNKLLTPTSYSQI
ncbi:MAG: NIPSNAP family protein [Planctomycetaceae bacterium]|nr:NIPSNAP family protein [Planctomycetaceae bacterium]